MESYKKQKLTKVKIQGFKSIRDQEVDLRHLNVLIGGNGAGKSNFFDVFTLLEKICQKQLGLYSIQQGIDNLLYYGRERTDHISIEFAFGEDGIYGFDLVPTEDDRLIFSREFYRVGSGPVSNITEAHSESVFAQSLCENIASSWRVYHFNDTSLKSKVRQTCGISDNTFLQSDAGNLAGFLCRLRVQFPKSYRQITDHIQLVVPYFGDFSLEPQEYSGEGIRLRWTERNRDAVLDAAQLSDGTLRFICLATLLLQPVELRPSIILIDEPEIGLSLYAIHIFSEMIRQASLHSQILLSTQSADLLDFFEVEDVLTANRNGNGTEFARLNREELQGWLEEYSLGELWQKNIFGGRLPR